MKRIFYSIFLFVFIALSFFSCVKEKNFPVVPSIIFKEYLSFNIDSADCVIDFKDGDGDIGALTGDTVPNLKLKYLFKGSDGAFHPYDQTPGTSKFDTLFYPYIIKDLTPDGQYKALDGEIRVKLRASPIYSPLHHIVKFEIQLTDRAGHLSNIVSTNEITVP